MIGRAVGVDSSDSLRLRNQYDDKNRVAAVVQKLDDTLVKTEYLYGEVEKQQKPGMLYGLKVNGTERASYTYDQLARQNKKVVQLDNGTYETSYSFLPGAKAGTTTTLLSSIKNGNNLLSYTYDELGNIETISENGVLKCTYHYDELSRLVREDNRWEEKTICYGYDNGGNLTKWKEYTYTEGVLTTGTTLLKENSYEYGNTVWKDQLTAYKGEAITYDNQGNPLTYTDMVMSWEKGRELKKIVWGDLVLTYTYDAAGRRIAKTELGVTTKYYWDGDKIIGLKQGNDRMQFVYDEKGNLFSMRLNGETYYYLFNGQNDVIGLIDSAGNQVVSYTYNSWGKTLSVTDTSGKSIGSKNPFRYRGYCYDEETGFYYVSSRYYDPEVGRFINADSTDILDVQDDLYDKNLYTYCDSNPITRADMEGEFWNIAAGAVIGGTISVTTQIIANAIAGDELGSGILTAAITGAASGALSATGLSVAFQVVGNAAISAVGESVNQVGSGTLNTKSGRMAVVKAVAAGAVGGLVGGHGMRHKSSGYYKTAQSAKKTATKVFTKKYSNTRTPSKILNRAIKKVKRVGYRESKKTGIKFAIGSILGQIITRIKKR